MKQKDRVIKNQTVLLSHRNTDQLNKTNSVFQKIVFACLRWKQLNQGASPRIKTDSSKLKNTSIAIEEVREGLIKFREITDEIARKQVNYE